MKTSAATVPPQSSENEETLTRRLGMFVFALGMGVLMLSFLSSCNTTRGFGRDLQHAGTSIERQADRVQSGR